MEFVENIKTQLKKGFLEVCILHLLSISALYSLDLIQKLEEHQILIKEGTLYPLLSKLKNEGFLLYYWEEAGQGPPRKYYFATEKGKEIAEILKTEILNYTQNIKNLLH